MARKPRADKDLQVASMFVAYEMEMIKRAGQVLDESGSDATKRNTALESFLIHARNLLHFLYESPIHAKPNDVIAFDYTKDSLKTCPPNYRDICARISKHLAHITYQRHKKETWDCQKLIDIIRKGLGEFLNKAPTSRLDPRWHTYDPLTSGLLLKTHGVTDSIGVLPSGKAWRL